MIFSVFSVALLNGRKNSNFFTIPDLDTIINRKIKVKPVKPQMFFQYWILTLDFCPKRFWLVEKFSTGLGISHLTSFHLFQGCETFGGSHVPSPSWPVCLWPRKYVQELLRIGPGFQHFDRPAGGWVTFMPWWSSSDFPTGNDSLI